MGRSENRAYVPVRAQRPRGYGKELGEWQASASMSAATSSMSPELPAVPPAMAHQRSIRYLLPSPISARHGLSVLLFGFAVEGATEAYQFLTRGNLAEGPLEYYSTIATTLLGFYLMFLGLREWHTFVPKRWPTKGAVPTRRRLRFGLALWLGGTIATTALGLAFAGQGTGSTPIWIAGPVGGLVVLAFGSFFFGLRKEAHPVGSAGGNLAGWIAFAWSLGVAAVAGTVVGDRAFLLLTEFVTNWVALVTSAAPIIVAMSPLFVTYALLIGAFWPAVRRRTFGPP
jgi:hypothetical protein